jgi:hypothetical protein
MEIAYTNVHNTCFNLFPNVIERNNLCFHDPKCFKWYFICSSMVTNLNGEKIKKQFFFDCLPANVPANVPKICKRSHFLLN